MVSCFGWLNDLGPARFRPPASRNGQTRRGREIEVGVPGGSFLSPRAKSGPGAGNRCNPVAVRQYAPEAEPRPGTPKFYGPEPDRAVWLSMRHVFSFVLLATWTVGDSAFQIRRGESWNGRENTLKARKSNSRRKWNSGVGESPDTIGYRVSEPGDSASFNHPCRSAYWTSCVRLRSPSFSAMRTR